MKQPKIRFKGFQGEWERAPLLDVVTLYNGLTYTPNDIRDHGTLVLRSSNVQEGEISLFDNVYVRSEAANSPNVKKGDIIVVVRNGSRTLIGKHAQIKSDMPNTVIGAFMAGMHTDEPEFLNALLCTSRFDNEVTINLGATINQITNGTFHSMKFLFPNKKEQKALGSYFQHLDSLIQSTTKKIESLKQVKAASLQSMFPQEGETTPRVRFKGFEGEWDVDIIGNICKITTGKSNTQDQVQDGKFPFFIRSEKIARSAKYLYNEEAIITIGDGNIGKVFHYIKGKFDLHQRCYMMYAFNNIIHAKFFYYYFATHFYDRAIKMSAKATVDSVRLDMIANMRIIYPSLAEQRAIASYFTNLDRQISLQGQRLEKLKQIKAACLDKMFV